MTTTSLPATSNPPTLASDRASYTVANKILHIPYAQLDDAEKSKYALDLTLGGTDNQGRYVFTLDPSKLKAIEAPHFTYEGEEAPEYWGGLTTDYLACGNGKNQSPIDIKTLSLVNANLGSIQFDYKPSALKILNNGHTIQANYDSGSGISVDGKRYELVQFHVHTPSEHTLNGKSFPMEIHFVHISNDGALAVVGVFLETGAANSQLSAIVNAIPKTQTPQTTVSGITIDANQFIPSQKLEYRYSGSLTTPPCTEGVKWLVLQGILPASADQLASFQSVLVKNNRPVQAENARNILRNAL